MGTLKYLGSSIIAKTSEEALEKLYKENSYRSVVIYSSNKKTLQKMIREIYSEIKERNKTIPNVNNQLLPTEPYYWDDIDGCLAVTCAEISADTFENAADKLYLFSQPRYDLLTNPNARKPLCDKALNTLAMLGHFVTRK